MDLLALQRDRAEDLRDGTLVIEDEREEGSILGDVILVREVLHPLHRGERRRSRIASTSSRNVVSVRIIRLRFSGVSHARIFPLSMIAMRSHIWSASAI